MSATDQFLQNNGKYAEGFAKGQLPLPPATGVAVVACMDARPSEIILIHHTDCGMLTFKDDDFRGRLEEETGVRPEWAAEAFSDLDADVRQNIERIRLSPFIKSKDSIRGFVYDVESGGCAKSAR